MKQIREISTDVLIIGSGGAGMRAAIEAHDLGADVLVLSKGKFGVSGATVTASADVNADSKSYCEMGWPEIPTIRRNSTLRTLYGAADS